MAHDSTNWFMPPPTADDLMPTHDGLPHPLDIIREFLDQVNSPQETFDPNGEWEHSYRILVALRGGFDKSWRVGGLRISRRMPAAGPVELGIEQSVSTEWYPETCRSRAKITCTMDTLSTPRRWTVQSVQLDMNAKPVNYSRTSISGQADGRVIRIDHGRSIRLGKRFTSNWSLFDAVQRLPFGGEPVAFDLLEDFEKPKRGHRICYSGATEVKLGGKLTSLHCFDHLGEGITPRTYWLDEQHRLVMVIGGLMTYLFDPNVTLMEEKQ